MKDLKRTTVWLPEDLRQRLAAEAERSRTSVAELVRRYLEVMTPPLGMMGELQKHIDKNGLLRVFVLNAREGQLLVEPGDGSEGLFKAMAQLWVDASLVTFPEEKATSQVSTPVVDIGRRAALQGSPDWKPEEPKK